MKNSCYIDCLCGDVEIHLQDGRDLSLVNLFHEHSSGKSNWIYYYDVSKEAIVPKKISDVFLAKYSCIKLDVYLSNGEIVSCSPDHQFLTLEGNYLSAINLRTDTELMPLRSSVHVLGITRSFCSTPVAMYNLKIDLAFNFSLGAGVFAQSSM